MFEKLQQKKEREIERELAASLQWRLLFIKYIT
jgi:hypothetical protein